jgi:hypothetical protein
MHLFVLSLFFGDETLQLYAHDTTMIESNFSYKRSYGRNLTLYLIDYYNQSTLINSVWIELLK